MKRVKIFCAETPVEAKEGLEELINQEWQIVSQSQDVNVYYADGQLRHRATITWTLVREETHAV